MAVDPYQTFLDTLATSEGDFEDRLVKLAELGVKHQEAARRKNYYKDLELDGIGSSLDTLIGVIDNPETAKEAEYQVAAYRGEAGSNIEHKINVMTLQNKLERRTEDVANYGLAIQEASDIIDSGETTFESKDYENIHTLFQDVNAKREAGGLKLYESPTAYLSAELDRTKKLIGRILPGMKLADDKNSYRNVFKYGKANNSDVDTYTQLYRHAGNIDAAMKALYGDNKITKEEAEAIYRGPEFYAETKAGAEKDAERLFGTARSNYNWWRNFHNKVEQGEYEFDPEAEEMKVISGTDSEKLKSGKRDDMLGVIAKLRAVYKDDMNFQDDKHFQWAGTHLIDRGNNADPSNLNNDEYYNQDNPDLSKQIPSDEEVSEEVEEVPSPYTELEEKVLKSKSFAIQKKGVKTVRELEQFDEEEISIKDQIVSLKKDHQVVKDRKEEVDAKIKSLSPGLVIDGVVQKDVQKEFRELQKESRELTQKLKHHGSYRKFSYKGKIDKLEKRLATLKKDKDAKLTRIESLLKVK
jgi:hypothetical protein